MASHLFSEVVICIYLSKLYLDLLLINVLKRGLLLLCVQFEIISKIHSEYSGLIQPSGSLQCAHTVKTHVLHSSYPFGYDNDVCFHSTKQADGMDCGVFPYSSGLINGKGAD